MAETADIYFAQFDDCDLLDFHDSTAECSEQEPMPNFASSNDSAVDNVEYPQAIATVAAAVVVLNNDGATTRLQFTFFWLMFAFGGAGSCH